jgi:hypothetical protein
MKANLKLLTLTLIFGPSLSGAATYYVSTFGSDNNIGTQAQPWRTIQKAANTLVAGDTAIILAGSYNEAISTTRNGSASGRISFIASGTVRTNAWNVLHDYITVNGFSLVNQEITISSRTASNGSYCEILNNDITAGSISMAYKSAPTGCLIKGNHLHGMVSPEGDAPQIQIWGTNHLVEQNEIGPNSDIDAFRFWGSGHVIRNNYVHDTTYSPGSLAHSDGFQTFGDNGDEMHDVIIENNRFINSEGQLFMTSQDGVAGIHDLIVRNNVFANYSQNGNVGLPNFYFYNNTLYNTGILYQVTGGPGKPCNGTNFVSKNNLFIGVAGCANADFDNVYNNPSGLPMTRAYNFYASCAGGTLRNYVAETGGINGGLAEFTNPAAADFTLKATSAAINKATALSGYSYDLLGNTRDLAWDMGAYEFGGVTGSSPSAPQPTATTTPTSTPQATSTPTATPASTSESLLGSSAPATISANDGVTYELGMKFSAKVTGTITAIRFYKSPSESGTHTGKIYSSTGALLASVTFMNESASGWQQQALATPLAIAANAIYTVSVNTGANSYVDTLNDFASAKSGTYLQTPIGAGVYGAIGAMPTTSWSNSNYFRDVVFVAGGSVAPSPTPVPTTTPGVVDTTAPSVTITSPVDGSSVQRNSSVAISAAATDNVSVAKVEFYVNGVLKCTDTTAPYSCNWTVPRGRNIPYSLQGRAYDAAGNSRSSLVVNVRSR